MSDVKEKSRVILHHFSKKLFKNSSLRKRFQYFVCVLNNGVNESFKTTNFFSYFSVGPPYTFRMRIKFYSSEPNNLHEEITR